MRPCQATTLKALNSLLVEQKQPNGAATTLSLMSFN